MNSVRTRRIMTEATAISEYPLADELIKLLGTTLDEAALETLRLTRLRAAVTRASQLPFYRDLWRGIDLDPRDVTSISDLESLPIFDIEDVRASIDAVPPFGRHQQLDDDLARVQFSGGTTGLPRPVAYTYWDRVLGEIMHARCLTKHGATERDWIINSMSYGPHNAAIAFDGAIHRYVGGTVLPLSTGHVTPSANQMRMMAQYGVTHVIASADYLIHLGKAATEAGYGLASDFALRSFTTIGDQKPVEELWGRPAYSCYGTFELQMCATECESRNGWHLWEDAYVVWVRDRNAGAALGPGGRGELIVTSLWSEGFPIVNLNTRDVSVLTARGECPCGVWFARLDGFHGRSDSMVKVRGINVWPEAVGTVLAESLEQHVEFLCVATRQDSRDDLTVFVELPEGTAHIDLVERMKTRLGVALPIRPVSPGGLTRLTRRDTAAKTTRFVDKRPMTTVDIGTDRNGAPTW
jgi:phenylacetate-CoA ligase